MELELLCLVEDLTKLSYFTRHTPYPITCHTDCRTILYLLNGHFSSDNAKLERFSAKLLSFDLQFKVEYTKPSNKILTLVDALSRQWHHTDDKKERRHYKEFDRDDIKHDFPNGACVPMKDLLQYVEENPLPTRPERPNKPINLDEHLDEDTQMLSIGESTNHPIAQVRHIFSMFDYLSIEKIVTAQSQDKRLRPLIDKLLDKPDHQDGVHKLYNNLLTRKKNLTEPFSPTNAVIEAPQELWGDIISFFHVLTGHCGSRRLYMLTSAYYHIPAGLAKCQKYCLGCYCCQLV